MNQPKAAANPQSAGVRKDEAFLEIRQITKLFDGHPAVDEISLTINRGEIFALLGASGCGKSTLLRMLAGFERPSSGQILLDGANIVEVPPYDRPINMMFQSYALFPHMTVFDNIAFGLKQDHVPRDEIAERVQRMLELVHMTQYARRKPHQLSGGQRQRVALARSLAKRPKLLLLDEPMGALDKKLREEMQLELVNIIEQVGVTCVMVTHDQEEAMTMANRIAIMDKGRLVQVGEPLEIYEYPNCRYSASFIGSVNLFDGIVESMESDYTVIACPDLENPIQVDHGLSVAEGLPVTIAVRPEKLHLTPENPQERLNCLSGVVDEIAYLGDVSIYHVRLPSGRKVLATLPNTSRAHKGSPTWGDTVHLGWDPDSCAVLLT
ncbi:MAG: putrescine ABC transporter ATP-binding subunit PotG [Rhodocyclaceae bacterium]|jgi:putrescine transport system ATP-binding protein|nr:putrescine ABC transporter ATP-binding subunit PotG [Rhodocyclaceae bacterium]